MDLELHFRNSDFAEALETYLERRLQFALAPFAGQVGLVTVRLADRDGGRGRTQRRCEIAAATAASGKVVAAESNADLYVAVDRAVRRLVRQLRQRLDRERRPGPDAGTCFRRPPRTGFTQGGVYAGAEV